MLALLFDEPGAQAVADVVAAGATMSTVNLAEVATVLIRHQRGVHDVLGARAAQVTGSRSAMADALAVAALSPPVSAKGLCLGDRACLALTQRVRAPAVTAEHAWAGLSRGINIQLIRSPHI